MFLKIYFVKLPNEQLKKDIQEFNIRWETAEQNEQEAMAKIEELNSKLMTMGVKDPEIEMLMREIENEQLVANQLEQKVREAKVRQDAGNLKRGDDQTSDLEKVSVMQWAKPVRDINRMERWSIAGIGGLAAMALTGYAIVRTPLWQRLSLGLSGLLLMAPNLTASLIGIAIAVPAGLAQLAAYRSGKAAPAG